MDDKGAFACCTVRVILGINFRKTEHGNNTIHSILYVIYLFSILEEQLEAEFDCVYVYVCACTVCVHHRHILARNPYLCSDMHTLK